MKPDFVLLISKEKSYVVDRNKDFHMEHGFIRSKDMINKKFGGVVKTNIGKKFYVVKPNVNDILKKVKRTAQVILPKDISLIIAYTGILSDGFVIDAGTGTGYLSIFLGHYLRDGKIVTYEENKNFYKIAKENIKITGLENISIKNKNVSSLSEKNFDLALLDMQKASKVIKKIFSGLVVGGWIVAYSPTIEHLSSVIKVMRKLKFSEIKTVENIVREWQVERTIRPKTVGLMHTGFITFCRKMGL